jgi:HAMP domain-containing protein
MARARFLVSRYKLTLTLGLIVFLAMAGFAFVLTRFFNDSLSDSTSEAQQAELLAIARSFNGEFSGSELSDPGSLQRSVESLESQNPGLDRVTILRPPEVGPGTERMVRVASTFSAAAPPELNDAIDQVSLQASGDELTGPLTSGVYGYGENEVNGQHFSELRFPLQNDAGENVALLTLFLDLAPKDAALSSSQQDLLIAAALIALVVVLLTMGSFARAVLRPLNRLGAATRRLRQGDRRTRLNWHRDDEIGFLARDFDDLAQELDTQQERVETMSQYREAQLAVASVLAESGTHEAVLPEVLDALGESFGWEAGAYWAREGDGIRCRVFWQRRDANLDGSFEALTMDTRLGMGEELPGRVFATAKPGSTDQLGARASSSRELAADHAGLGSAVALPVVRGGETVGVIEFFAARNRQDGRQPAGVPV